MKRVQILFHFLMILKFTQHQSLWKCVQHLLGYQSKLQKCTTPSRVKLACSRYFTTSKSIQQPCDSQHYLNRQRTCF
ncbi:hypothetical protein X975_23863, partial [Stegodyphus mimosarum]